MSNTCSLTIHPYMDTLVISISLQLCIMLQWTWEYKYCFQIVILILLNMYSEVELLDQLVVQFLIFWGNSVLFSLMAVPIYISLMAVPIYISTNSVHFSLFSTLLPTLIISYLFDNSYPNVCEVTSHCDIHLHFSNN